MNYGGVIVKMEVEVQNVHHNNFKNSAPSMLFLILYLRNILLKNVRGARKLLEKSNNSNHNSYHIDFTKNLKPLYSMTFNYFSYTVDIIY